MNKTNLAKLLIAVLLIAVVAVATYNYGLEQRKKAAAPSDPTKSSLPTIKEDASKQAENNAKSEDKADTKNDTAGIDTPSNPPVQAQIPSQNIPATGPADTLIPAAVLGALTGGYIISRRRLKASKRLS